MYGVGSSYGGWVDLFKRDLHQKMYGSENLGEMHEIYNLAVPGAVISDLAKRCTVELQTIRKPERQLIAIVQLGANNAKAVGRPNNFTSTPEQYEKEATAFLQRICELCDDVICLGMRPMDQQKVMPIYKDKEKGGKVYFPNDRIAKFEKIIDKVARKFDIKFVPLFEEALQSDPNAKLLWNDGIHPNDEGHRLLYEKVKQSVNDLVKL